MRKFFMYLPTLFFTLCTYACEEEKTEHGSYECAQHTHGWMSDVVRADPERKEEYGGQGQNEAPEIPDKDGIGDVEVDDWYDKYANLFFLIVNDEIIDRQSDLYRYIWWQYRAYR